MPEESRDRDRHEFESGSIRLDVIDVGNPEVRYWDASGDTETPITTTGGRDTDVLGDRLREASDDGTLTPTDGVHEETTTYKGDLWSVRVEQAGSIVDVHLNTVDSRLGTTRPGETLSGEQAQDLLGAIEAAREGGAL